MRADKRRRELARQVREWTVEDLHDQLVDAGVHRLYIVHENGEFLLSHPRILAPVQAFLELSQDFAQHEAIFIGREDGIPTLFFVFVHDTRRGLAQGGLRFKPYPTVSEILVDGLRLSRGMTRKNALADLWWGGGKGILPVSVAIDSSKVRTTPATDDEVKDERRQVFAAYGRFVAGLGGVYYTAEDVGTNTPDMNVILGENRFTTCIHSRMGGSGNPSPFTARGVLRAMQAAWLFLGKGESLAGVRVAVQGAGNVGSPLIELLDEARAEVWVSDIDPQKIAVLQEKRPKVKRVANEDIYDLDVDIFAPCAIGASVNAETIPRLKAKLVCGAANNILREKADAQRLRERGIEFVPDYLCNRMGITNCADEWYGYLREDIQIAAEKVFPDTLRVLRHARYLAVTSTEAADELADIAASELHPQLGHRGRRIVDHLLASGWKHDKRRRKPVRDLPFEPALHEPGIRLRWEKEGFAGNGTAIAATPVSTASRPNLATIFSATLMDVQARASEWLTGERPRRILGSDHGGHALQLAVEQSLANERDEVGRRLFEEKCRDVHSSNDAAIREQLHQLGVGFDPPSWLDPMQEDGARICRHLFEELSAAGVIAEKRRLAHHCPHCATVLVASDVKRSRLQLKTNYRLRFLTCAGSEIDSFTFYPELVIGMVALAVRSDGPYGELAGQSVVSPLDGAELPTIAATDLPTDAEIIVPSYSQADYLRARMHGITQAPPVYDETGRIRFADGDRLPPKAARARVLERFGELAVAETGTWDVDIQRCGRCQAIVHPSFSNELYISFGEAIQRLRKMIDDDVVQLSHPRWRKRVLDHLDNREPWCISRQLWWGNPIPGRPRDVFSTWFSLASWSLQGAGWPDNPELEAVAPVFVDPDLLLRWVVPSLLVSVTVTGQPVFRRIAVHGSVHVVERALEERRTAAETDPDEERFHFRTVRRPMRRRRGNVVEPESLFRRFGSDALRLGLLLSWSSPAKGAVVVSETRFRHARNLIRRFVAKLDGVFELLRRGHRCGEPRLADVWIVSTAAAATNEARIAFEHERLADAARHLITVLEAYTRYANVVADRRSESRDLGALRESTAEFLTATKQAFSPICPFLFDRLDSWIRERRVDGEQVPESRLWLPGLVTVLHEQRRRPVEVAASDPDALSFLEGGVQELARLSGAPVRLTENPAEGVARGFGPVVVIRPGALAVTGDECEATEWYRERHGSQRGGRGEYTEREGG